MVSDLWWWETNQYSKQKSCNAQRPNPGYKFRMERCHLQVPIGILKIQFCLQILATPALSTLSMELPLLLKYFSWRINDGCMDKRVGIDSFHFFSNFPASRIPKVKVTRTPNVITTNPVVNRATGKVPLVKATWTVKYLVKPEQKKMRSTSFRVDLMTNQWIRPRGLWWL